MNTITSPIASVTAVSALAPTLAPAVLTAEQDIINLRAQLEEAEARKAHLLHEEAQTIAKVRHDTILGFASLLGVTNLPEVVALIRREMAGAPIKRPFPNALSEDTKAQMKAMLMAFSTTHAVASALKVGVSTVDSYKAKWGLTHRQIPGRPVRSTPKARKAQRVGSHFSPAKKARIIEALSKPDAVISVIARREHTSRQALYDLRAREHLIAA